MNPQQLGSKTPQRAHTHTHRKVAVAAVGDALLVEKVVLFGQRRQLANSEPAEKNGLPIGFFSARSHSCGAPAEPLQSPCSPDDAE